MTLRKILPPSFKTVVLYLLTLAALWPCIEATRNAFELISRFPLTSDEAQHAEMIQVLSRTGKYANWSGDPFVLSLTTGPTVIVPAAVLKALTGLPATLAGRIVTLSYFLGFLLFMWRMLYRLSRREEALAALGLGVFFLGWRANQEMIYFLYGILGDGVGLFYVCFSTYAFSKNRFFSAGLLAALAALSKPYLILYPLTLAALGFVLHLRDRRSVSLKSTFRLWAGIAAPFSGWIGWMLLQEGFHRILEIWIHYFTHTGQKAVSRAGYSQNGISELVYRLKNLHVLFKARSILLALAGFFFATRERLGKHGLLLRIFGALHFAWWMALSDGQQSRYAVPTFFCGWLALAWMIPPALSRWTRLRDRLAISKKQSLAFASLCLILVLIPSVRELRKNRLNPNLNPLVAQLRLQNFWKSLSSSSPTVWSTNPTSFDSDEEVFLVAPHFEKRFNPTEVDPHAWPKSGDLVLLTDLSAAGTGEWVRTHRCSALMKLSLKEYGFYRCP